MRLGKGGKEDDGEGVKVKLLLGIYYERDTGSG